MNNWPLALRSNQVTSLCTWRSSSASRLSNPHRSSGTICPVKYPALTLFQILTAMLKHIFLTDKRLICRRVFISFIILFIVLFYFIFFYLYLLVNFYQKSYPFLVFLTYWLTLFQILTAMLKHIFLTDKRLICRRVFISFIILFIVLFYFIFFYLYLLVNFYHKSYPFLVFLTYWLTPFQILTDKRLICRVFTCRVFICRVFIFCRVFIYFCRVFISFIILFIVLFYFIFFLPFTCL